ncbi:MAG: spore coat protein [Oscillospiraceae bacterium]|nr:spore coat protein [Oscillospiraceae bacterium]
MAANSLTQKELIALEETLNSEALVIKKLRAYAASAQDPQIKTTCEQLSNRHKQHYDTLMGYLY